MKFGIVFDDRKNEAKKFASKIKVWLENKKYEVNYDAINVDTDFIITLGGDGLILQTANEIVSKNLNIPIIRVNLGHVGALANIEPNEIFERLQEFLNGNYIIKKRTRIHVKVYSFLKTFLQEFDALNEIVVERIQTRAISFLVNGDKKSGDGVIIATQTGSTAYNHIAGGQVLVKDGIVLTIVSPSQSESSLINPTSFIFEIHNIQGKSRLVADGNMLMPIKNEFLIIKKSEKMTYFIEIGDVSKYGR